MRNSLFLYLRIITIMIIFLYNAVGNGSEGKKGDVILILEKSFQNIYLAKHGLEYPYTEEHLTRCIRLNDKPCLDVFNRVTEGKNTIRSLPADTALNTTLDIIETACLSKNESIANFICYGGIMSLYLYNSPKQDAKILAKVRKYPKKVRSLIFNQEFNWYYNRPNYKRWTTYISEADVDWAHKIQKQFISDMFKKNITDLDEKPWALR